MATTSLKLSDELRQRAADAAARSGVSPHAFMVGAIAQAASAAEQRAAFVAEAQQAHAQMRKSGKGYDVDEVHDYLKARIVGKSANKPKARSWRG